MLSINCPCVCVCVCGQIIFLGHYARFVFGIFYQLGLTNAGFTLSVTQPPTSLPLLF